MSPHRSLAKWGKRVLPRGFAVGLKRALVSVSTARARRQFSRAPLHPQWLGRAELEELYQRYPRPTAYGYSPRETELRGAERSREILSLLPASVQRGHFLELGSSDGMTSRALRETGVRATAVDLELERFDRRAVGAGVHFAGMDASRLCFPDNTFDVIFSYNSFEHFSDPAAVLAEAVRVLRPGGFLYIVFNPLYMSPYGLHVYWMVPVPYCQHLFPVEMLQSFAEEKGLTSRPFEYVNGWTADEFRALWSRMSDRLKPLRYLETHHGLGAELIEAYPSCFRSKTDGFHNLTIAGIEALFQKR